MCCKSIELKFWENEMSETLWELESRRNKSTMCMYDAFKAWMLGDKLEKTESCVRIISDLFLVETQDCEGDNFLEDTSDNLLVSLNKTYRLLIA